MSALLPMRSAGVRPREFEAERVPKGMGLETFESEDARNINRARLDFLASLDLPIEGRRVLDVGCGVGHHVAFYRSRGCKVVCVDGRAANLDVLRERHPDVECHRADVQSDRLAQLGGFEVVHCFGLLYHLESPVAALRNIAEVCRELLVLETIVTDHPEPLMVIEDESRSNNQALAGLGCRPTPSFVTLALTRAGFAHVYGTRGAPDYPDFRFRERGDLASRRDGHNLRRVFVASRDPVVQRGLVPLLDRP